ncbi:MAG: PrgI family protein [Candidatus Uhrbacteria bacterium]|nr:PrgI family protein [Candidatus Uhrbacteria bacterium]
MPEKFVVPQFIDTEDKILGPITVRQFLVMLAAVFIIFIEYKLFRFGYFVVIGVLTAAVASVFSFLKINGQPFHIFFVNFLQTSLRPPLRVWHKDLADAELRLYIALKKVVPPPPVIIKPPPTSSHLRDMALTVNTGGVYNPEES